MRHVSGNLYKESGDIYVLLHTPLGWIAMGLADLRCFGVPRKDVEEAVEDLTYIGLKIDIKKAMIDPEIDTQESEVSDE